MASALLSPLGDIVRATAGGLRVQAATALATVLLGVVATGFLTTAGVVVLAGAIGVPLAAASFALIFALAALAVHLLGQAAAARRAAKVREARRAAVGKIARQTGTVAGPARSLLPLAAFMVAFALTRRP